MDEERRVAVFDIDGTIFRSSLLIELVDVCIAQGVFPQDARALFDEEKRLWQDRKGEYSAYIAGVVTAFGKYIVGVEKGQFDEIARDVIGTHKDRVYRYTRDLIKKLSDERYFLLAISHSPKELVDLFCKHLGFHKVYARIYTIDSNNLFTGNVQDEDMIDDKATMLKRAIEKEQLTLTGSYGVGDTSADISFLSLVEHPICFNPSSNLYKHAKQEGWKVILERKDMIYEL